MTLSELFNLRETIESRINQYWTFWSVTIFAVCGWLFTGSAKTVLQDSVPIFIIIGLLCFLVANFLMLRSSTQLSVSIHDEICKQIENSALSETFKENVAAGRVKFRVGLTMFIHVFIDAVFICFLISQSW